MLADIVDVGRAVGFTLANGLSRNRYNAFAPAGVDRKPSGALLCDEMIQAPGGARPRLPVARTPKSESCSTPHELFTADGFRSACTHFRLFVELLVSQRNKLQERT